MTFSRRQAVLVDTNVILEAHRTGCWNALCEYFEVHTVRTVVEETQTGYQNRDPQTWIDQAVLRKQLAHVADIDDRQRIDFNLRHGHPGLDPGERDLLIYAESLGGTAWLLNSPDLAVIRFASKLDWLDRLVSLEAMVKHLKARLARTLRDNYTESWLSSNRVRFRLGGL